jgi:hypothetical protein
LEDGADIAPYRIDGSGSRVRWAPEGPPDHPVVFENHLPVWIGSWPRIVVESVSRFEDGLIEVEPESRGSQPDAGRVLRIGPDVPITSANDRAWLDLGAAEALRETYGPVRLSCRLAAVPDQPPLVLRLVRVRPISLEYVDDPKHPGRVAAVQVRTLQSVAAGAGTTLTVFSGGERVASASNLDGPPSIRLALPDSRVELRVRVPGTRVRLLSARRPLDGWKEPGQLGIHLAEIALDDRLRVELHLGAELERGRPLCRLVGGAEVASGKPSRLPGVFDIPLNRWLDRLGPEAAGMVQVRGRSRWVDLVRLVGRGSETNGGDEETSQWQRMVRELDRAAAREDPEQVERWMSACLDRVRAADASVAEREMLRLAVARVSVHLGDNSRASQALEGLDGRDDLYEPRVVRRALELRRGAVARQDILRRAEAMRDLPADFPLKQIVTAEHYVHCADGPGTQYWRSCRETIESIPWPPAPEAMDGGWTTDRKEALLLHAMATFRVGRVPEVPDRVPASGQWRWLSALAFSAARISSAGLRAPAGRSIPEADLPRPPLFRERDADLARIVLHQAAGRTEAAAALLERFQGMSPEEFHAIGLLRLRQARLEGQRDEAKRLHRSCLAWAREKDHKTLRYVLMDEPVELEVDPEVAGDRSH